MQQIVDALLDADRHSAGHLCLRTFHQLPQRLSGLLSFQVPDRCLQGCPGHRVPSDAPKKVAYTPWIGHILAQQCRNQVILQNLPATCNRLVSIKRTFPGHALAPPCQPLTASLYQQNQTVACDPKACLKRRHQGQSNLTNCQFFNSHQVELVPVCNRTEGPSGPSVAPDR